MPLATTIRTPWAVVSGPFRCAESNGSLHSSVALLVPATQAKTCLISEIQNSTQSADTSFRSNQRRNGPAYRRCSGKTTDRDANPKKRAGGCVGVRGAEYAEAESCPADQNNLADERGIAAAMDERVDEPAADYQISESGEEPGHAGVKNGVEQIYMQGRGKIAGEPGEQQIESVIVRSVAEHEALDFALAQEV